MKKAKVDKDFELFYENKLVAKICEKAYLLLYSINENERNDIWTLLSNI